MKINCIFVVSNCFRRNSKINFHDKSSPKVNSTERAVLPFLKRLDTPKGELALYNLFKMSNKKRIVTTATSSSVTPSCAFYAKYFSYLSTSRTQLDAFAKASLDYYNLFQIFPYLSFNHFKTANHGAAS